MVSVHTHTGEYIYVSNACFNLFGWHPHELIAQNDWGFIHADDMPRVAQEYDNVGQINYRYKCKGGDYRWVETKTNLSSDGFIIRITRAVGAHNLSDVKRQLIELQEKASKDPLTGLWRRDVIIEIIERELKTSRIKGKKLSIIMIDVDYLKVVNDTRGHLAGDEIIKQVATAIKAEIRASDSASRYGGDEFVIVLPDCDRPGAVRVGESIQFRLREFNNRISLSVGAVTSQAHSSPERLINKADQLMYQAKEMRDCVIGGGTDDLPISHAEDD